MRPYIRFWDWPIFGNLYKFNRAPFGAMKVVARVIIQIEGSPKQHVQDTLKSYVDKIEKEYADIKIVKRHTSPAKKKGTLYSLFTELELAVDGAENLVYFCLDYMPASVEIVEPDSMVFETRHFTNFLNDLQQKLHKVDMTMKNLAAENQVLRKNALTLSFNLLQVQLMTGPKDAESLSKGAGIPPEHAKMFLSSLVKDGKVKIDKGIYRLA
jgi:hypothetical protein